MTLKLYPLEHTKNFSVNNVGIQYLVLVFSVILALFHEICVNNSQKKAQLLLAATATSKNCEKIFRFVVSNRHHKIDWPVDCLTAQMWHRYGAQ